MKIEVHYKSLENAHLKVHCIHKYVYTRINNKVHLKNTFQKSRFYLLGYKVNLSVNYTKMILKYSCITTLQSPNSSKKIPHTTTI